VDLLHRAACCEVAEVDGSEACVLEQRDDFRFRGGVVAGDEDHARAAGFVWIRAEHVGAERVGGFDELRAGNEIGNELARRSPVQVVGSPVVGRVDYRLPVPVDGTIAAV
jgi:hypothetical protein